MMENRKGIKIASSLCLLPGIFLIVSGFLLLFVPSAAQVLFDMKGVDNALSFAMGIRQFCIGFMIVALALSNQIKALALIMLIGSVIPAADFFIFSPVIGWESALRHAASVPFIFGLGTYLLLQIKKQSR